jgi:hypothetical protein
MIKKISLFIIIIIILFNSSILANSKILNEKAENIINKQLEIKDFQTDIILEIAAFSSQYSKFNFTYYYQEPDKIYLETEDFVLLPREAIKTLQPNFFHLDRYNYKYLKTSEKFKLFELQPKENKDKYRLILWLDLEASVVKHAEIFFQIEEYKEEFAVQIDYNQIEGYSLPVYVEGKLAVPTKFSIDGKVKESKKGSFTLELSNYKINSGLPARIKKKLLNRQ